MENPCRILCFGDSLTRDYAPGFERGLREYVPEIEATVVNAGVGGETSRDGLNRLPQALDEDADVALVGFGMNDHNHGISCVELADNLRKMIVALEERGARVLLLTLNPVGPGGDNERIDAFNEIIRDVALAERVRVVDIAAEWKRTFERPSAGLRDGCHPNDRGLELYHRVLVRTVPRRSRIVLWQYNGNPCACNYNCPYCQYDPHDQAGHHFTGTIEGWRDALKRAFGNQHAIFYFGHGEPMIGKNWFDVVEMIGSEPNWEMRCISNFSVDLTRLLESRVAREGRLNLNASFHPTEIDRGKFLAKLLQCRRCGIEVPVVYTLWPPFFDRFEDDFRAFDEHGFLVHVRRFIGEHDGRRYPGAYTDDQRRFLARYADDATIRYMLCNEPTDGKLTWAGVDFFICDNLGNVGYCDDFRPDRLCLGNVLDDTFRPLLAPQPFPGLGVSDGTVDGVSCILELDYPQLEANHIIDYARRGGVVWTPDGVTYKHLDTDFTDPRVRAEYRFPARNIRDAWAVLTCPAEPFRTRLRRLAEAMFPERFNYRTGFSIREFIRHVARTGLERIPLVGRVIVGIGRRARALLAGGTEG
jgi:lysophospholipase L1-like esterase